MVLTGCAHAGIVNTVRFGLELTGATPLSAVVGGFHLLRATPDRIRKTIEALRALEPDLLVPLHCTGDQAMVEPVRERLATGCGTPMWEANSASRADTLPHPEAAP